ncbi:hypothetical protein SNEBB_010386 [Seison nebaliae]|nr:hypothetical protein SNEBB_010386 [Seison nebaliae]
MLICILIINFDFVYSTFTFRGLNLDHYHKTLHTHAHQYVKELSKKWYFEMFSPFPIEHTDKYSLYRLGSRFNKQHPYLLKIRWESSEDDIFPYSATLNEMATLKDLYQQVLQRGRLDAMIAMDSRFSFKRLIPLPIYSMHIDPDIEGGRFPHLDPLKKYSALLTKGSTHSVNGRWLSITDIIRNPLDEQLSIPQAPNAVDILIILKQMMYFVQTLHEGRFFLCGTSPNTILLDMSWVRNVNRIKNHLRKKFYWKMRSGKLKRLGPKNLNFRRLLKKIRQQVYKNNTNSDYQCLTDTGNYKWRNIMSVNSRIARKFANQKVSLNTEQIDQYLSYPNVLFANIGEGKFLKPTVSLNLAISASTKVDCSHSNDWCDIAYATFLLILRASDEFHWKNLKMEQTRKNVKIKYGYNIVEQPYFDSNILPEKYKQMWKNRYKKAWRFKPLYDLFSDAVIPRNLKIETGDKNIYQKNIWISKDDFIRIVTNDRLLSILSVRHFYEEDWLFNNHNITDDELRNVRDKKKLYEKELFTIITFLTKTHCRVNAAEEFDVDAMRKKFFK